jgi:hypothetical protein
MIRMLNTLVPRVAVSVPVVVGQRLEQPVQAERVHLLLVLLLMMMNP